MCVYIYFFFPRSSFAIAYEHWNLVADVAEKSLGENKKKKKKQDITVVSTEFTIDFSGGDHYKGRKKIPFHLSVCLPDRLMIL